MAIGSESFLVKVYTDVGQEDCFGSNDEVCQLCIYCYISFPCWFCVTASFGVSNLLRFVSYGQASLTFSFLQSIKNAQGFIFLYKTSSRDSFEAFATERERIARLKQLDSIPMLIVAYIDKEDPQERQVSTDEGQVLAKTFGGMFVEYAPKSGKIDSLFLQLVKDVRNFETGYRMYSLLFSDH